MNDLQTLLKKHIENNHFTIYSLANRSGINRTTLHKALSGDRPISKENLDKLIPFFQLTPAAKEELENAYYKEQIGSDTLEQYTAIRQMVVSLSLPFRHLEEPMRFYPHEIPMSGTVLQGRSSILHNLVNLIHVTYKNKEHPAIRIFGAPDSASWQDFGVSLYPLFHKTCPDLNIEHILPLCTDYEEVSSIPNNVEIFSNILPYLFIAPERISVSCYYNKGTDFDFAFPYPYYILLDQYVFSLSRDLEEAIFLHLPSPNRYQGIFEALLQYTVPIKTRKLDSASFSKLLSSYNNEAAFYYFGNKDYIKELLTTYPSGISIISDTPTNIAGKKRIATQASLSLSKEIVNGASHHICKKLVSTKIKPNQHLTIFSDGNKDVTFAYQIEKDLYHVCTITEPALALAFIDFATNMDCLELCESFV